MEVKFGVSARHVHLTEEDFKYLYGARCNITKSRDLSQIGEFACNEKVNLIGNTGKIENVRILGPFRNYTQVEISKTDAYVLGLNPPVRDSEDLEGSEKITIEHNGKTLIKECCIISMRHIHINNNELNKYNLRDGQIVRLKVNGIKGGILDNVKIKASNLYNLEAHIDLDDANAHLLKTGDIGDIINE
ncbi:MAG TPA: phosphate propanoyltransferase [Bacilli bacterium]|nr:phosphate propanoyltransferase [Bacilli bacterium]